MSKVVGEQYMFQSGVDNHSRLVREGDRSNTEVDLFTQECAGRGALEHYISKKYLQVHDAHINECLPILVGIRDKAEPLAAFGLRPGHYRPMFLEQYLDSPIEQQVASISKHPIDRCSLIEIGNMAITRKGYGPLAMVVLAMSLAEAGYEWMVFTITEQVEKLMKRLGFEPHYLAGADPSRLQGEPSIWGSYYNNNPRVMVGNIRTAVDIITQSSRLSAIANEQRDNITDIASSLRDYRRLMEAQ
jgi:hypothetical protein